MYYAVTHLTIYHYTEPISDSVMEVRMQPRNDPNQRCLRFNLEVRPRARVFSHRDYLGNTIHSFNIPGTHERLALKAEGVAEVKAPAPLPDALPYGAWDEIDQHSRERDLYDMVMPSHFTEPTALLDDFAAEIRWGRTTDPLTLVRGLNTQIYEAFDYQQHVTKADSPIDVALAERRGVCQDFAHIMLALTRQVGIPSRYVSGYLYHRKEEHDRSDADASHAWVECWLPGLGWVGFDPTNNLVVSDRHIRVGVASDYGNASPSRGVFHGAADSTLEVRVKVEALDELPMEEAALAPEIELPQYAQGSGGAAGSAAAQSQQQQQ